MHKYSTSKWFFIALLCTDCTDCADFLRCVPCGSTNRNMFIEKPGFLKALASQCPIHQFHALRISCGFKIVLHICLGFDDQVSHNRNYNITLHHFISSQFSCRKKSINEQQHRQENTKNRIYNGKFWSLGGRALSVRMASSPTYSPWWCDQSIGQDCARKHCSCGRTPSRVLQLLPSEAPQT